MPVAVSRIGVIVHPARDIGEPVATLQAWCTDHEVSLAEVLVPNLPQRLAGRVVVAAATDCDLLVAVGGDGTMLAAARIAMTAGRPVLGVGYGSLGVLARVQPEHLRDALERFAAGEWSAEALPGIQITRPGHDDLVALNDLSVVRAGIGQIRVAIEVDGVLYGRIAGDGVIVATALGSSAYSLAAGGPLLAPGGDGFVISPLPTHGGSVPPLVAGTASTVTLDVDGGYGGARLELDGQIVTGAPERLTLHEAADVVSLVALAGAPPALTVLRERGIVRDSPRVVVEDQRANRREN